MLSKEDNDLITHVGPGTAMGDLLRRYWTPACLSSEIPTADCTPLRVRLLGEDLVAFRDSQGRIGLIDENCPHRGTSLFFGRNEESGLRCVYHGWKFDVNGDCVDMPSEPERPCVRGLAGGSPLGAWVASSADALVRRRGYQVPNTEKPRRRAGASLSLSHSQAGIRRPP